MSEEITCPEPIRAYLRALLAAGCVEAVRRVAEAPDETWTRLDYVRKGGRCCLQGHAEGWTWDPKWGPTCGSYAVKVAVPWQDTDRAVRAWDNLAKRRTIPRAARIVRAEAERLLG